MLYSHLLAYFHEEGVGGIAIGSGTPLTTMSTNLAGAPRLHDYHIQFYRRTGASSVVIANIVVGLRPFTLVQVYFAQPLGQISMSDQFL